MIGEYGYVLSDGIFWLRSISNFVVKAGLALRGGESQFSGPFVISSVPVGLISDNLIAVAACAVLQRNFTPQNSLLIDTVSSLEMGDIAIFPS